MKITDKLDQALEDGLRMAHALKGSEGVLIALRDAMTGQPGAASYDSPVVGGHTTVVDEYGTPMPAVSDITGDAAIVWAMGLDVAVNDHRALLRHLTTACNAIEAAVPIVAAWQKRAATAKERRDTERSNELGCEFHLKAGVWAAPFVLSSTVAGALDDRVRSCRDCYERIRVTGSRPSDDDVRHHVDHGKWPKLRIAS